MYSVCVYLHHTGMHDDILIGVFRHMTSQNSIPNPAVWVYIRDVYYHRGHRLIGAVATPHGDNLSWWAGDISSGERKHKDEEGERKKARDGPSRFPLGVKFHEKLRSVTCLLAISIALGATE